MLYFILENSIKDNNFQNRNRIIFQLTALRSASHDLNIFTNLSGFIASMLVNLMQGLFVNDLFQSNYFVIFDRIKRGI